MHCERQGTVTVYGAELSELGVPWQTQGGAPILDILFPRSHYR